MRWELDGIIRGVSVEMTLELSCIQEGYILERDISMYKDYGVKLICSRKAAESMA